MSIEKVRTIVYFNLTERVMASAGTAEIQAQTGLNEAQLGAALLGLALGLVISASATGSLVARHGAHRIALLGLAVMGLSQAGPGLAESLWPLTGAFVLIGLASGLVDVSMNAWAVGVETRGGRPILGACHGVFSLGGMLGAGLGAAMAALDVSLFVHFTAAGVVFAGMAIAQGCGTIVLEVILNSALEPMDASDSAASGFGSITITIDEMGNATYSGSLSVDGIAVSELMTVGPFSAIHLHNAPAGENGGVVQDFIVDAGGDVNGATMMGDVFDEVVEVDTLTSIQNVLLADGTIVTPPSMDAPIMEVLSVSEAGEAPASKTARLEPDSSDFDASASSQFSVEVDQDDFRAPLAEASDM